MIINGLPLDISHLEPFERKVSSTLHGNIQKSIPVRWSFSGHCYTRAKTESDQLVDGAWYDDGSEHHPRLRLYCSIRYNLSLQLPQRIDALINHDELLSKSGHGNYFVFQAPPVTGGAVSFTNDYLIFMKPTKVVEPNVQKHIKIVVESAYPKSEAKNLPKAIQTLTFSQMLAKTWSG